jgi:hypothetical protein
MFLWAKLKARIITGPSPIPIPIPTLTCPDTPELGLRRSRPAQSICYSYGFQSSPAFSRICPASVCRITASGILVQYAG